MGRVSMDPRAYVRASVDVDPTTGCWNWTKAVRANGYGWCGRRDWRGSAHRFAYTHFVGPIPDGLTIDHLCRNRRCINPEHLEAVSGAENTRRRVAAQPRSFSVFFESRGLWAAVHSEGSEPNRVRKTFRSRDRDEAIRRMTTWLDAR